MPVAAPTAAILIIGTEILRGKTADANTSWIASQLLARGIEVREARTVIDDTTAIIEAVNALRARYDFVFTTGGIGPTHDDITSASIAAAFGKKHLLNEEAREYMAASYAARGTQLNEARLRMATMPEGATLITPCMTGAPGFKIENVFVLAGIPSVMQDMWPSVETHLPTAASIQSKTIMTHLKEGDFADDLALIQNRHADVDIGSYPVSSGMEFEVRLILTASNPESLAAAATEVREMVTRLEAAIGTA